MKTKVFLGLVVLGLLVCACTVEELKNENYEFNGDIETQEYYNIPTDSTIIDMPDYDTGGEDDPGGD